MHHRSRNGHRIRTTAFSPGSPGHSTRGAEVAVMDSPQNYLAVIKVVGIGGGGVNAVNRMIEGGLRGGGVIAIKTDAPTLLMFYAQGKLGNRPAANPGLRGRPRP